MLEKVIDILSEYTQKDSKEIYLVCKQAVLL